MAQPFRSLVLDHVGSTNREALALAEAGLKGPLWLVARRQTAGHGRADRPWISEPGNLHATLLTQLPCPPAAMPQLSLVIGIATLDAIRQAAPAAGQPDGLPGLRLKWPNDVLIGGAKCAGILIESLTAPHGITAAIGIGIDLVSHPQGLDRATTDLSAHGCRISPEAMLACLAETVPHWLAVWDGGSGFGAIRQAWLDRAGPVGEGCTVKAGQERIEGTFADLDAGGALVLCDRQGQRRTVTFGDVALAASVAAAASQETPGRRAD